MLNLSLNTFKPSISSKKVLFLEFGWYICTVVTKCCHRDLRKLLTLKSRLCKLLECVTLMIWSRDIGIIRRKGLFEKRSTWKVPKISLPSFWECVIQPSRKCAVKQTICRGSGVEIPVRAESENPGWKLKWTFYNKFYESCRTAQFSINFWSK